MLKDRTRLQAHSSFIGRKILCKTLGTLMAAPSQGLSGCLRLASENFTSTLMAYANLPDPLTPHPTRCGPCKNTNIKWTWCLDGARENLFTELTWPGFGDNVDLNCKTITKEDGTTAAEGAVECQDTTNCEIDFNNFPGKPGDGTGTNLQYLQYRHKRTGDILGKSIRINIIPILEKGDTKHYFDSDRDLEIEDKDRLEPVFSEKLKFLNNAFNLQVGVASFRFYGHCKGDVIDEHTYKKNEREHPICPFNNKSGYIRRRSHYEGKYQFNLLAEKDGQEYRARFVITCTDGIKPPMHFNTCKSQETQHSCINFESVIDPVTHGITTESLGCSDGTNVDNDACSSFPACCLENACEEKYIVANDWIGTHISTTTACKEALKKDPCYYKENIWNDSRNQRVWHNPGSTPNPFWVPKACRGPDQNGWGADIASDPDRCPY